jgi:hypothetical protein
MNKIDELIGRALTEDDRALLARHAEPGYFAQALGLFRGPQAWVMWITNIAGGIAFFAGLYALWRMAEAPDAVSAVKCGIGALFLFQVTLLGKLLSMARLEANRLLREVKRLELQVSLLAAERAGSGRDAR